MNCTRLIAKPVKSCSYHPLASKVPCQYGSEMHVAGRCRGQFVMDYGVSRSIKGQPDGSLNKAGARSSRAAQWDGQLWQLTSVCHHIAAACEISPVIPTRQNNRGAGCYDSTIIQS